MFLFYYKGYNHSMNQDIKRYIEAQDERNKKTCQRLYAEITNCLPVVENKVWHAHPVWFLDGNPTVGFSVQKPGVRLLFWSGADFDEPKLVPGTGKFKDASIFYQSISEIDASDIERWCEKARVIQWDYKNLVKRKGEIGRAHV